MRIYSNKKRPVKASDGGRKWVNTEVTKAEWDKLRKFLKANGYKFEPSEAGFMVHVECYLNDAEIKKVNDFIDTLDDVKSACGKKSVKSSTRRRSVKASYGGWSKFYGLDDVEFTVPNDMDDPTIFYNGGYYNYYDIEDALWSTYKEDCAENGVIPDENDFEGWVAENSYLVYDFLDNASAKKQPGRGVYRDEPNTLRGTTASTRRRPVRATRYNDSNYTVMYEIYINDKASDLEFDTEDEAYDYAVNKVAKENPAASIKIYKNFYDYNGKSKELSFVDAEWCDTVTASTRRRPVRASMNRKRKPIMAGAGAGYTIDWTLDTIRKVNSFDVTDVDIDEFGLAVVRADCDVDIEVTIRSAWSYMYGFDHPISNVPAKLLQIEFELALDDWNEYLRSENYEGGFSNPTLIDEAKNAVYQINEMEAFNVLEDAAWNSIQQDHYTYGGGWSHSTWDGTISELDEYHYATIQVTDQMVIDYVDKAVTDENIMTEYWIDFYLFEDEYFDTLEEARATAIQAYQSGELEDDVTIMKTEWHEILLNIEGESDFDDPEQEEVETLYADDYIVPSEDEE